MMRDGFWEGDDEITRKHPDANCVPDAPTHVMCNCSFVKIT